MSDMTNRQRRAAKVQEEFDRIREKYASDPRQNTLNVLAYGPWGGGKTTFAGTSRPPILYHSFDPGGTTAIEDKINEGKIIPDTSWEISQEGYQDLKRGVTSDGVKAVTDPQVFEQWAKEVNHLHKKGVFENVGTFVIDSYTTFADALMAWIKSKRGTQGKKNTFDDWGANRDKTKDIMKQLMTLPCNVILTAHADVERDEVTGEMIGGPMAPGKLTIEMPMLFDEVYFLNSEGEGDDAKYYLYTKKHRMYPARSRLASQHDLDAVIEDPKFIEILNAAGYPWKPVQLPEPEQAPAE